MIYGFINLYFFTNKQNSQYLSIKFIDVGQGDSILITTPKGKTILIDTGESYEADTFLYPRGVFYTCKLDVLILTHDHADHTFGTDRILRRCPGAKILSNFGNFRNESTKLTTGNTFIVDNVTFNVLWPPEDLPNQTDKNVASIVILAEYGGFSILLTGDAPGEVLCNVCNTAMQRGISYKKCVKPDILKVSHHGSKDGICATIRPEVSIISVGERNKFRHPNSEVIRFYENYDIPIYRTDHLGTIEVTYKSENDPIIIHGL